MDFGEKLKTLRKKKGWTQREVADMLSVSPRTYASYELEGREPKDIDKYYILAEIFGVSKDYFIESSKGMAKINLGDLFPGGGATEVTDEVRAKMLTDELVTLFMKGEMSSRFRDDIAERIMNAYWDAKRGDDIRVKG